MEIGGALRQLTVRTGRGATAQRREDGEGACAQGPGARRGRGGGWGRSRKSSYKQNRNGIESASCNRSGGRFRGGASVVRFVYSRPPASAKAKLTRLPATGAKCAARIRSTHRTFWPFRFRCYRLDLCYLCFIPCVPLFILPPLLHCISLICRSLPVTSLS